MEGVQAAERPLCRRPGMTDIQGRGYDAVVDNVHHPLEPHAACVLEFCQLVRQKRCLVDAGAQELRVLSDNGAAPRGFAAQVGPAGTIVPHLVRLANS